MKKNISQQITFLHSEDLLATKQFYNKVLGLQLVRDQGSCVIFKVNENAFIGFCEHITPIDTDRSVILTLVTDEVDDWYDVLQEEGIKLISEPEQNPKFHIYHFFFHDPDGYWIEIQRFDEPL
jgi:catechol 2,3-dioxygenase-like lactoylglutathione lyase family enzyme